jgi:hypothetical protein
MYFLCCSMYFLCCSVFFVALCILCVALCIFCVVLSFYVALCIFCVALCIFCVTLCIILCYSMYFLCCSMWCVFCDVPCIVCVCMCTEQLPPGGYPIAVKYIISYHIISYHIIWWAQNNASKGQMGFNSAFKGLNPYIRQEICPSDIWPYTTGVISIVPHLSAVTNKLATIYRSTMQSTVGYRVLVVSEDSLFPWEG